VIGSEVRPSIPPRRALATSPGPRIVALGGGTGLPILLHGLKTLLAPSDGQRLTAIVTVADDGGSSGRLRRAYRILAPGDVRNCLLALSDAPSTLASLFDFRFDGSGDVGGHSLGNLILTALNEMEGDFTAAVSRASEILGVRGHVLPSTGDDVTLVAELMDGTVIAGESRIASGHRPIARVRLRPETARALPGAIDAIRAADLIVIGAGSLYTSLLPILLVKDLGAAIAASRARVVMVANMMTEPGETDGYAVADFVHAIERHAPGIHIDDVLVNTGAPPVDVLARYAEAGAFPVPMEPTALRHLGCRVWSRDLLGGGTRIAHDPEKLAQAILELAR